MNLKHPCRVIGLDIGGANIKASDGGNFHHHEPFALWQTPADLGGKLTEILALAPPHDFVAITMTGELTDCFENKQSGVAYIIDQTSQATNLPIHVYLVDGRFVDVHIAKQEYQLAAASNWHALASFVAREISEHSCGLLIDMGSTTTDVIAFRHGNVETSGVDDFGRLLHGELVYTGSIRSAVNGILQHVTHRGQRCPVMNEMFATTLDTNIILGNLLAGENEFYTADGGASTLESCVRRLARLIGKDDQTFDLNDAREISTQVFESQVQAVASAMMKVTQHQKLEQPVPVVSGQGEFLAAAAARQVDTELGLQDIVPLGERLGPAASNCATAFAIARLAIGWIAGQGGSGNE